MPQPRHTDSLLSILPKSPSAKELFAGFGHFSGSSSASNRDLPPTRGQESLVDPLTNPVAPGAGSSYGGQTTEALIRQLTLESQVGRGLTGSDTSGGGSSALNTILGLLGGGSGGGLGGGVFGGGGSGGGVLGTLLGSGFGLSPLSSGILGLFGGGGQTAPAPLIPFQLPSPVQFQGGIDAPGGGGLTAADYGAGGTPRAVQSGSQSITVHVNAMDSKSFIDHSDDIARAVRHAMLQSNSLNDVVAGI